MAAHTKSQMRSTVGVVLLAFVAACGGSDGWWNDGWHGHGASSAAAPGSTWRTPDGRLAVHVAVPMDVEACRPLEALGRVCTDGDRDGLTDAWEATVLEQLVPVVRLTIDDPFFADPEAKLVAIGRVHRRGDRRVLVNIVLAYTRDYGSCELGAHPGDAERVALLLDAPTPHDAVVSATFLAAHEGGTVYDEPNLGAMQYLDPPDEFRANGDTGPRWLVYASEKKHASYPNVAACEAARDLVCLVETCGTPLDASGFDFGDPGDVHPPVYNAGEADARLLSALDDIGFIGEDAWDDQAFCGGAPRSGACPPSIRSKLAHDPFLGR